MEMMMKEIKSSSVFDISWFAILLTSSDNITHQVIAKSNL